MFLRTLPFLLFSSSALAQVFSVPGTLTLLPTELAFATRTSSGGEGSSCASCWSWMNAAVTDKIDGTDTSAVLVDFRKDDPADECDSATEAYVRFFLKSQSNQAATLQTSLDGVNWGYVQTSAYANSGSDFNEPPNESSVVIQTLNGQAYFKYDTSAGTMQQNAWNLLGCRSSGGFTWLPTPASVTDTFTPGDTNAPVDYKKDDSVAGECAGAEEALIYMHFRDGQTNQIITSSHTDGGTKNRLSTIAYSGTGNDRSWGLGTRAILQVTEGVWWKGEVNGSGSVWDGANHQLLACRDTQ